MSCGHPSDIISTRKETHMVINMTRAVQSLVCTALSLEGSFNEVRVFTLAF